ncbi:hypothetical protein RIF29_39113 [Crotalaria pallida]|uniref:Cytochrome c oxidase copper chaperone n=1 Tax=Crotalaria pallida TaxID=3830 RepID=A0AAN9HT01_CROPI
MKQEGIRLHLELYGLGGWRNGKVVASNLGNSLSACEGRFDSMGGTQSTNDSSPSTLRGSQQNQGSATATSCDVSKPKKKICCACPDTKRLRDECIVEHGEAACTKWIEAHRLCLRAEGFNV